MSAFGQAASQLDLDSFEKVWTTVRDKHWQTKPGGLDWQAIHDEYRPRVEKAASHDEARAVIQEMLGPPEAKPLRDYSRGGVLGSGRRSGRPGRDRDRRARSGRAGRGDGRRSGLPGRKAGRPARLADRADGRKDLKPVIDQARSNPAIHELQLTRALLARLSGPIGGTLERRFWTVRARPSTLSSGSDCAARGALGLRESAGAARLVRKQDSMRADGLRPLQHVSGSSACHGQLPADRGKLQACDGLIIDLRGNPGGIGGMAMGMAGFLVDKPNQRLGTMYLRDSTLNFVVNPRAEVFSGPVAVLVDGCSASTSEIFAGGLKDLGRARIFGTRTAAAALPSAFERLPNGDGFQYAVANYISEGGQPLEGLGVTPDVVVELTRAALLAGHDPVVDAAAG